MMKVSCLVIDDDEQYTEFIASFVESDTRLILVGKFHNPIEAMQFIANNEVQLIISDVKMPGLTGLDMIKSMKSPPLIIFISSFASYAIDSYEVNAIDYLKKPIKEDRLTQAIDKAIEIIELRKNKDNTSSVTEKIESDNEYFIIKPDTNFIKLKFSDVTYVEAMADFVKIHTIPKSYLISNTLKRVEESLPESMFLRVQRSYIVNTDKITAFNNAEVYLNTLKSPLVYPTVRALWRN